MNGRDPLARSLFLGPELLAVRGVVKPIRDIELAVDREQQRQPAGIARIQILLQTRLPPNASEPSVAFSFRRAQHCRGRMMKKSAERSPAKLLVILCVQNELMPKIVRDLRRHRYELPAPHKVRKEELPQGLGREIAVLKRQLRTLTL
jgi:hypothetical protein